MGVSRSRDVTDRDTKMDKEAGEGGDGLKTKVNLLFLFVCFTDTPTSLQLDKTLKPEGQKGQEETQENN